MNTEILFLVEESQEGGYVAESIQYSIFTEADTLEELKIMIKDAVSQHFKEEERPKLIHLHIVRDEVIVV
jgi:predicted RNase H-like HicB family nuclease